MSARRRRVGEQLAPSSTNLSSYNSHQISAGPSSDLGVQENGNLLASAQQQYQVTMTSRDRTQEFSNAVLSMQSRNTYRAAGVKNPRQARHLQSYSNFMMIAKNIGKNIASTYSKLEKLAFCEYLELLSLIFLKLLFSF